MKQAYSDRPFPPSLWQATACAAPDTPALADSGQADVVIVGAGFTGLSAALHLAEQGVDVAVLETAQPGWGASGRNGGQVIPGLKYDPDELLRRFGAERGEAMTAMAGSAADLVFDLIDKYRMRCDPVRKGWIQTAHSAQMLRTVTQRAEQWARRGAPVEILEGKDVAARIGGGRFTGGWIDHRAGSVQPLGYTRGLAHAALAQGARIHGNTRVTSLKRAADRWRVGTERGHSLTASHVLIATNGYTDGLWPGLRRTVLAAQSFLVATRPLHGSEDTILPGREVTSDSRRLLVYFRRDADGRLVLGGRGPFDMPHAASEWAHIERAVTLMFPRLKGIEYEYRWQGRLAVTADFMPHVHEPAPGLSIVLGYNGRGIAMATMMGKMIAGRIRQGRAGDFPYPVTPISPIPLHGLQRWYMAAGVAWYRLLDALS
ncbi:FAD-dependent oxidoreductase [Pusillimonas sp. TS35]|uniref:NAD(P)/FAD-dependent oxidoreductase n=1 Tax=Paracandidimonas lactea TaxID=2895524 RepID=UPI00136DBC17|nr:FAD-dependent oxidoreductase [Paracandidimonas lactea]MYN13991.1 FAD-dependent oxidoreductase [Pusillimonas sp. TS35]